LAKNGQNPEKGVKIPDSRDLAAGPRGVLHQPLSRRGPVTPVSRGVSGARGPVPGRALPETPRSVESLQAAAGLERELR